MGRERVGVWLSARSDAVQEILQVPVLARVARVHTGTLRPLAVEVDLEVAPAREDHVALVP